MEKQYKVTFIASIYVNVDTPEEFDPRDCNLVIPEHNAAYTKIIKEAAKTVVDNPEMYLYDGYIEEVDYDTCIS